MNAVNKYNKNCFLFGLHRKSELANFGDVVINNKSEIIKLFYLILAHTSNLLNSDKGLEELKRLCPNVYKLVVVNKSRYYLHKLMGFISGLNSNKRVDVMVILDKYLQPHLIQLLHQMTTNDIDNGFNSTVNNSSSTDNSLIEDLRDDSSEEFDNERNRKLKLNKNIQFYNPQRD
ncbi:hypothetical protein MACK_000451 [Theileria orientalis]|uniref:Uncharacterized protein n=1 Tax=Theileria orientalis TaxID=68886 RepID=A0A976QS35_THEOR|nr:hypothetical protein MACK_000451 [Theileria orientalis]